MRSRMGLRDETHPRLSGREEAILFQEEARPQSMEQPKYYLPEKFGEQVAQMGKLGLRTGRLTVKLEIKKLLYEQKVWRKLDEDG